MLKFFVKVFKSLYLLNLLMGIVDTLPDVRYSSEVLCCTIITHISDLAVKLMDFEFLSLSFLLKFFFYFSVMETIYADSLSDFGRPCDTDLWVMK